jgi:hypothetical protein
MGEITQPKTSFLTLALNKVKTQEDPNRPDTLPAQTSLNPLASCDIDSVIEEEGA